MVEGNTGVCYKCNLPAKLLCPTCIEMKRGKAYFCTMRCLRLSWKEHNAEHYSEPDSNADDAPFNPWPNYKFTGNLRPAYPLSPLRVPDLSIPFPSYACRGVPYSENSLARSSVIEILSEQDRPKMYAAGEIARDIMEQCRTMIKPGVTTDSIDEFVSFECDRRGVYPSLLNYRGFPKSCATSVNEVAALGIPDRRKLEEGDILNIQIGVYHKGFHSSLIECFEVGHTRHENLIRITREAMKSAISVCKAGEHYRNVGKAVDAVLKGTNYCNVLDHHGRGTNFMWRAPPRVPSYTINTPGIMLPGHAFTVRLVITEKNPNYRVWPNGIVSVTELGTPTAQLECTLLVTGKNVDVLTKLKNQEQ